MSNLYNGGDIMPNINSAKKRVKVIKTKTLQNQMIKSQLKTAIKIHRVIAFFVYSTRR